MKNIKNLYQCVLASSIEQQVFEKDLSMDIVIKNLSLSMRSSGFNWPIVIRKRSEYRISLYQRVLADLIDK